MFKIFIITTVSIFISSCSSLPPFKKTTPGKDGYVVEDLNSKDHFRYVVQLPAGTDHINAQKYYLRAAGQECEARGFQFFDFGHFGPNTLDGFCFTESSRKILGICFKDEAYQASPRQFIVKKLFSKPSTLLQTNDEILSTENEPLTSLAQLKSIIFKAASNKKKSMTLKIKRQNKDMQIDEPLIDVQHANLDNSKLEDHCNAIK